MTEKDLKIFEAGIENFEDFKYKFLPDIDREQCKKEIKKLKIILFFFSLLNIIFGKKRRDYELCKIKLTYAKSHSRILSNYSEYNEIIWGRNISTLRELKSVNNLIGYVNRKVIFKGLLKGIKYIGLRNIPYYLEFLIIKNLLDNNDIKEVIIAGHQDRQATWLSYLCQEKEIIFIISQHGILSSLGAPNKIYADKVFSYNVFEEEFFKNYLIKNRDCKYFIKGLESTFDVKELNNGLFNIGIFSQYGETLETLKLVKYLKKIPEKNCNLIVYPHPREDKKVYEKLKNQGVNVSYEKHSDIDVLLTYRSTIIYDYKSLEKFKGKILYYPKDFKYDLAFEKVDNIIKINTPEEVLSRIKEIKNGRK